MWIRVWLTAFATLLPLHLAFAQGSRQGCEPLEPIGNAPDPRDSAYNRCALERAPMLLASSPMLGQPLEDTQPGGTFYVIVNADGRVDQHLTQIFSRTSDTTFFRHAMETIRQWRFEPGIYRGAPVRSQFELEIESTEREDTLPSKLTWIYYRGTDADTLRGTWTTAEAVAPFDTAATDRVYAALVRHLIRRQIVKTNYTGPELYCLVLEKGDSIEHERISNLLEHIINPPRGIDFNGTPLAPYGCERSVSRQRIIIPHVYRTENGRAVMFPSGDYLPNWPPDPAGRTWSNWSGRCVAMVPANGSVWIDCELMPVYRPDDLGAPVKKKSR